MLTAENYRQVRERLLMELSKINLDDANEILKYQLNLVDEILDAESAKTLDATEHMKKVRAFGDALAHRLLTTHALRQLAKNPTAKPVSLSSQGEGFRTTVAWARKLGNEGFLTLIADLTNIVKIGDLILCDDPEKPDIVECKNKLSKPRYMFLGRKKRQFTRAFETAQYLKSDIRHNEILQNILSAENSKTLIEDSLPDQGDGGSSTSENQAERNAADRTRGAEAESQQPEPIGRVLKATAHSEQVEWVWSAVEALIPRASTDLTWIETEPGAGLAVCKNTIECTEDFVAGSAFVRQQRVPLFLCHAGLLAGNPLYSPPMVWPIPIEQRIALMEEECLLFRCLDLISLEEAITAQGVPVRLCVDDSGNLCFEVIDPHPLRELHINVRPITDVLYGFQTIQSAARIYASMAKKMIKDATDTIRDLTQAAVGVSITKMDPQNNDGPGAIIVSPNAVEPPNEPSSTGQEALAGESKRSIDNT